MPANIFSTYSTGENRVTASLLAVLQSLSLGRIERLLGAILQSSQFQLVEFENQPSKGGKGVPDAIIVSSCRLLIETKIKPNTVKAQQLQRHLDRLKVATEATKVLLVLTPDERIPAVFSSFSQQSIAWSSFTAFDQAIDELLGDPHEVVSEREAFLLRELQSLFLREKLIATPNDVVVVAARDAWPEYQKFHAYVCQPDRPFQLVRRMAFYTDGQVFPLVPKILDVYEHVEFTQGLHKGKLGSLVERLLKESPRGIGNPYKVIFLSAPDSPDTIHLEHSLPNDITAKNGRNWAFTQSQRYVALDKLRSAKTTSQLVDG